MSLPFDKIFFAAGLLYCGAVGLWLLQPATAPTSQSREPQISPQDAQFIAYLQRSLQTIQTAPSASAPTPTPLATLPVSQAPAPPVNPPPVVEKYYYPVYPTPAPQALAPLPRPPRTAPPPVLTPAPRPSIPPLVTTKQTYELIGVLEAGDQSHALFNTADMTLRLQVGETLGASGWTLTGVDSQKAILSRQGKTRYLEVGQHF